MEKIIFALKIYIFKLKMYIFKVKMYIFSLNTYIFNLNIYLSLYSGHPCHQGKATLKPRGSILIINSCHKRH